eukprot:gene12345-25974_t
MAEDDYKEHANLIKEKGNTALESGDIELAVQLYSQAIDIDPDNHVLYSNRSAAYMKADSKSKALKDAEKCVALAPNWSKGYNRLGAAQQSLKRFDNAIDSFKRGIEKDPNNQSLWSALRIAEEAFEQDKKIRFEIAANERAIEEERMRVRNESKIKKTAVQKDTDLLSSFFSEVQQPTSTPTPETTSTSTQMPPNIPLNTEAEAKAPEEDLLAGFFSEITSTTKENKPVIEKNEKILTEKYTNFDLGTPKDQLERLTAPHYQWRNCNPYEVLQLDIDATEEDIKY